MPALALPLADQSREPVPANYPEVPANEDWVSDEETLRCYAVGTCQNAWGLVYSQLFDGLKCKEACHGSSRKDNNSRTGGSHTVGR
jgi:hypothetical protein